MHQEGMSWPAPIHACMHTEKKPQAGRRGGFMQAIEKGRVCSSTGTWEQEKRRSKRTTRHSTVVARRDPRPPVPPLSIGQEGIPSSHVFPPTYKCQAPEETKS